MTLSSRFFRKMKLCLYNLSVTILCLAVVGCGRQPIERIEWTSMGTVAAVQYRGDVEPLVTDLVMRCFSDAESLLSAHSGESELSRMVAFSDEKILAECTEWVRPCYVAAFSLRNQSGCVFNPRWKGPDTLDLGAIAKGFAVDVAAERVRPKSDMLIDLGGNLKAVKGSWTVGVKGGMSFLLQEGAACATSARYYRGDHIRDGRNGTSVSNGLYSVTVIHPSSAMIADGLSTILFIMGREKGTRFINDHYPDAKVIWTNDAAVDAGSR